MKQLKDLLKAATIQKREQPLWDGPEANTSNGGITFSMLSRFLVCRERFRIRVIEGLKPAPTFNHKIEYGQLWHTCEEALAKGNNYLSALELYVSGLSKRYPYQREQINHWWEVCKLQFPLYVKHWQKHADVKDRTPLLQEQVFNVPYQLPSGRIVQLRGKWDAVDVINNKKLGKGIWIQENKSKGEIREQQIKRQLSFDLQTMMYLVAMVVYRRNMNQNLRDTIEGNGDYPKGFPSNQVTRDLLIETNSLPIMGVRYNVIRRPLSGGKGNIKQLKAKGKRPAETKEQYYKRVAAYITKEPKSYFMRWNIEVTPDEIIRFCKQCLDPILENLCWWYVEITNPVGYTLDKYPSPPMHWRHPYGVYNVLDEGGTTDLDEYLYSGSTVGLRKVDKLFEELT